MADRVGQQLGNYQLTRLLGEGGFAQVYLGEHIHLGTQAALKVLYTQLSNDEVDKFRTEARTIARLEHPHIERVLDFGMEGSTPFLVMDYAPGGTLRTRHPKGTHLPLATVVSYIKQIAPALQYAHEHKLIHRDIKPENLLIGRTNEILLSDFGIALVAQSSHYQSTRDMAGTIAYMAPEQIEAHPRPASDQYSLGIVIYELLSGDRPFHGTFTKIAIKHSVVPPPPLREKVPTLPPAVEQVVMTALAKEPKERFASLQVFATALEQASQVTLSETFSTSPSAPSGAVTSLRQSSLPTEMDTPPIPLSHPPETMTSRGPSQQQSVIANHSIGKLQPTRQGISRRTVVLGLTGLAVVGVVGGGLAWLTRSQGTRGTGLASSPTATPRPPAIITQTSPTATPTNWSGWSLVPGNGITPSALATIPSEGKEYLFVRGTDSRIYVNTLKLA